MNLARRILTNKQGFGRSNARGNGDHLDERMTQRKGAPAELVERLCRTLATEKISYCHWKSNNALDRSARGETDLDLLVDRADMPRFTAALGRLGFKQAFAPPIKQMPGVVDFFGFDEVADRLIHVHAHYQLVLGHDLTKNFRLPVERHYLASAAQGDLFRVPAPEWEYIVLVVRMVLKHLTRDALFWGEDALKPKELAELTALESRVDDERVHDILKRCLPQIGSALFNQCVEGLRPGRSVRSRIRTGRQLTSTLRANARRAAPVDAALKLWRRVVLAIRRRVFGAPRKYLLASGGAVVAIVGGDGAGKSTAIDGLRVWLGQHFRVATFHMGRPPWSCTTAFIRGLLKVGNVLGFYPVESSFEETLTQTSFLSPAYPWLVRQVCMARDRCLTYTQARRFAAKGRLVILDRFPLPQLHIMDGARTARFIDELKALEPPDRSVVSRARGRFGKYLVTLEEAYYQQCASPEQLIVLRLDPAIAIQRRADEDATVIGERSAAVLRLDWEQTGAHVIDASMSKADVLRALKCLIWSQL